MEQQSVFELIRSLQGEINARLRAVPLDELGRQERGLISDINQSIVELKNDMRDYIAAETDDETKDAVKVATERLTALQELLLEAGNKGIFGPADIAIVSALAEQIAAKL